MTSWQEFMDKEKEASYMFILQDSLKDEKTKYQIFPPNDEVFNAFKYTPFNKVKVVLLGQDPYIHPGQAHGLAFSVKKGVTVPPSLVNIYKELHDDIGFTIPSHGELTEWTNQGVFLLNSILTVRRGASSTHATLGWMNFTDAAIKALSDHREGIIFVLWGNFAKAKRMLIDETKHHVLTAAHPSPRSANRGFFGCKHFSEINDLLKKQGVEPIDWKITDEERKVDITSESVSERAEGATTDNP